jgi:hypothetical protein
VPAGERVSRGNKESLGKLKRARTAQLGSSENASKLGSRKKNGHGSKAAVVSPPSFCLGLDQYGELQTPLLMVCLRP